MRKRKFWMIDRTNHLDEYDLFTKAAFKRGFMKVSHWLRWLAYRDAKRKQPKRHKGESHETENWGTHQDNLH